MPKNSTRMAQGGDVQGETKIDMTGAVNVGATSVAKASYDPGYDQTGEDCMDATLQAGYVTMADVKRGYASYGQAIGEGEWDMKKVR